MSPDRVRVMVLGSQRQVDSRTRWAEANVSRGCYTVIKNDSVRYPQAALLVTRGILWPKKKTVGVSLFFHRFDHSLVINECHMGVH